jgi:hypothetical protein
LGDTQRVYASTVPSFGISGVGQIRQAWWGHFKLTFPRLRIRGWLVRRCEEREIGAILFREVRRFSRGALNGDPFGGDVDVEGDAES